MVQTNQSTVKVQEFRQLYKQAKELRDRIRLHIKQVKVTNPNHCPF